MSVDIRGIRGEVSSRGLLGCDAV